MENLTKAVKIYYGDSKHDGHSLFALWERQVKNPEEVILRPELYPKLMASTDMAWQKRSSGNRYDSNSGDAFLVDSETRLPITWIIKSKICSICQRHDHDAAPVRDHKCMINHDGSAGSMEPLAVLDMVVEAHTKFFVVIERLITDDDSSMKAKLKWSNADHMLNNNSNERPRIINKNGNLVLRPNHGALPRHIPEPTFLADPNHRKKTLKGDLYRQLKKRKAVRDGLTRVDIMRIATNFAYMMRTLSTKPEAEHVNCGKAVVEDHFDNHEHCGVFCKRKLLTDEQKQQSTKIYRCKKKDAKLYLFLTTVVARFITPQALKEVAHGSDTQVNESLNNSVTWFAQRNKTYAATSSLGNRVCLALGIYSLGYREYFERLFHRFGIVMPDDIRFYLAKQEQTRAYRIANDKKTEVKKLRNIKLHDKLRLFSAKVKGAAAGAQYNTGIGMDGGYCQPAATGAAAASAVAATRGTAACSSCGKTTHKRRTNKLCQFYMPPATRDNINPSAHQDAEEQGLLDEVGFDAEDDEFFDAFELENDLCDDDGEGDPVVRAII